MLRWEKAYRIYRLGLTTIAALLIAIPPLTADAKTSFKDRVKIKKRSQLIETNNEVGEDYNLEKQRVISSKRRALLLDIKRFLQEASSEDQKAELNLRLGNLTVEEYYGSLAIAQHEYEIALKEFEAKKTPKAKPPAMNTAESKQFLLKAKGIYEDLIKRYPKHPRYPEMLYFTAQINLDNGNQTLAMKFFGKIFESYPKSKFAFEAATQLADYYFDKSDFAKAETYYNRVIAEKHPQLSPYAVYKKGWCAYNTQHYDLAKKSFQWVIGHEAQGKGASIQLRNEAIRDMALVFADLKQPKEGVEFYRELGQPSYRQGVESLAGIFYDKGEHKSAAQLYSLLLELDPTNPKNPSYDIKIVTSLRAMNREHEAVDRLFERLPTYLGHSNWHELNHSNPKVLAEANDLFEDTSRKYALEYHAQAQKSQEKKLYDVAKKLYAKYLEFFSQTSHSAEIRFYLAEILFKEEIFPAAAEHYYLVYQHPHAGKLRWNGIRYSLTALDRKLNQDRQKKGLALITHKSTAKLKEEIEKDLEPLPYSPIETKFIDVSEEYLKVFKAQKDAPDVLYERAYLQYDHHDFGKSYKSFWDLIREYPTHTASMSAGYLVLDILNRNKKYPVLIAACQKLLQLKEIADPKFKAHVADVLRHAELKRIALLEDQKKYKEAADEYVEYTKAYGPQDVVLYEKALYNASISYTKASENMSAVETEEKFLRRFPKSELRKDMLLQVAKSYEQMAIFDKAASYYEAYTLEFPSSPQAPTSLRLAGLYYWGAHQPKKAELAMGRFLKTYPTQSKLVESDLINLYESTQSYDALARHYLQLRAIRGTSFADYLALTMKVMETQKAAKGRFQQELLEEAWNVATKHHRDIAPSPNGAEALSKLRLFVANQKESQFQKIALALPQARLEKNLQTKMALLKELETEYETIIRLGHADFGLAAIYKSASIYRQMAKSVSEAPVPAELSAEQIDVYRAEIEKQMVKPFNEKALSLSVQCLDKAQEFSVLSAWTAHCYSLAAELEPARYPKVRTFFLPPVQVAILRPSRETKFPQGSYKDYTYPYYSGGLFNQDGLRSLATIESKDSLDSLASAPDCSPVALSYQNLGDERQRLLLGLLKDEKPENLRTPPSIAYLNLLRTLEPKRAVPILLSALQKDPSNEALHNLLGLSYMEYGNFPSAKVTWLSILVRNANQPEILNNLGVLALNEGKEDEALSYFKSAEQNKSVQAMANLGAIALKYRNGFEAKKHFVNASRIDKNNTTVRMGLAVSLLQNRELDKAKDQLIETSEKLKTDPYARLSLGYYLIDIDKDYELAEKILGQYMNSQSAETDIHFRQAMQEARGNRSSGELPSIE